MRSLGGQHHRGCGTRMRAIDFSSRELCEPPIRTTGVRPRLTGLTTALVALLLVTLCTAEAQGAAKTVTVGYFSPAAPPNPVDAAFEQSLQRLGWLKDQNIRIEYRHSRGRQDLIAPFAAELVSRKVDVFVAWGAH